MKILIVGLSAAYSAARACLAYYEPHPGNQFNFVMSLLLAATMFVASLEQPDYV